MVMNKIIAFLRLIRIQNLLILAATQYLLRYAIFLPILDRHQLFLQMSEIQFFLLVLSTVLIAGAGYAINDYFDIKIDRVNKPDTIIVGRLIKRRVAMGVHFVLTSLGIMLGLYVSQAIGKTYLVGIHVLSAAILWFYAFYLKRTFLIGNLAIALMAAMVPYIVALYEIPLLEKTYKEFHAAFDVLYFWSYGYAVFAFVFTLAREIVKDMADVEGDKAFKCRTIPIVLGIEKTKYIVNFIHLMALFLGYYLIENTFLNDNTTLTFFIVFVAIPLIYVIYKTHFGTNRTDFLQVAKLNKLVSLAGIMYMLLARYMIYNGPLF